MTEGASFPLIPLGEVADFTNGYAFGPADWGKSGLPIIRIQQLLNPSAEADSCEAMVGDRYLIETGDLVMSWSGTIAVVRWDRGPAWLNQHLFRVDAKPGVDEAFLKHLLDSSLVGLEAAAHGTTMKHIKRGDLLRHDVLLPSEQEQRRIAEILDTIDETIQATENVIAQLGTTRSGMLDELTASVVGTDETPIGDVVTDPLCYGIVQVGDHVRGGVPVVAIRDLGGAFGSELHRTDPATDARYPRSRVRGGEVLLSIKGTVGRVGLVPTGFHGNISRDVALIRPGSDVTPSFLKLFLESSIGQRRLGRIAVGTTRAELSIHALRRVSVAVPRLPEQERIVGALSALDERLEAETSEMAKLRNMRSGLAADLLSGRVRTVVV